MELNQLEKKTGFLITKFIEQLKIELAGTLKSALLYGSLAQGDYSQKHSDINILLVLNKLDGECLRRIAKIKQNAQFKKIAVMVLSKTDLENSTDTFPIEFLDMQEGSLVLFGEDCLKGLTIDIRNLRHQCEGELKSKIMHMQQLYIRSSCKAGALTEFLIKNFPSFIIVFKNILRLKRIREDKKDAILEKIAIEFTLDKGIFDELYQARIGKGRIADSRQAFERFLFELRKLSEEVDAFVVKEIVL